MPNFPHHHVWCLIACLALCTKLFGFDTLLIIDVHMGFAASTDSNLDHFMSLRWTAVFRRLVGTRAGKETYEHTGAMCWYVSFFVLVLAKR